MNSKRALPQTLLAMTLPLAFAAPSTQAKPDAASWRGQSITEFSPDESRDLNWQVVNDGVMGGLSKGKIEITDAETMKFSGTLSLENNGGFSTVRSGKVDLNLSNDLGLLLRVKGDGRTYQARFDSDARFRGMAVSFAGEFETTKGEWQQVKIPFSDFEGSFRGTDLPDQKLDPSAIERIGILLGDKQPGVFDLEIDWIRTYGKGQGNFTERTKGKPTSEESGAEVKSGSLIATAVADGRFKTLKAALDAAGLTTFFQWDNKLTVFAPTDEAFAKLPKGALEDLLKPENKDKLVAILSYHVSAGDNRLADALKAEAVETVQGASLSVGFSEGSVRVNGARVIDADVVCSDGVIHVIDTVLLPPESKAQTARPVQNPKNAIMAAVEKGVPLYNRGDAGACADVYRDCLAELAADRQFSDHTRGMLTAVIEQGENHHSADTLAWHYRKALDGMMVLLERAAN